MSLILSEKEKKKRKKKIAKCFRKFRERNVSRKDMDCGVAHELVGDSVELAAGSAVTDLGLEVLTLGGQMEGVDLDPLLHIDALSSSSLCTVRRVVPQLSVHCETCCPPAVCAL